MIPGDIDLTENLDFRKTRRKELPALPEKWGKNNNSIIRCDNLYYDDIDGSIITFTDYIVDSNGWFSISTSDNTTSASIEYTNSYNLTINTNSNTYYLNSITLSDFGYTWSVNTDNIVMHKPVKKKDIFGNIIMEEKPIEKICWHNKELSYKYKDRSDKSIPWKKVNRVSLKRYHIDNIQIPWDIEDSYVRKKESISDRICYLAGKTSRFISRYLNRDSEDLTSYLTNMNWIRVHDAVID